MDCWGGGALRNLSKPKKSPGAKVAQGVPLGQDSWL